MNTEYSYAVKLVCNLEDRQFTNESIQIRENTVSSLLHGDEAKQVDEGSKKIL